MAVKPAADPPRFPRRKAVVFGVLTVTVSLGLALLCGEVALRLLRQHVESSDDLDKGLFRYDFRLGWRLASDWRGRHRHYDFDVPYATNRHGFRGAFPVAADGRRVAVVGDSFTFGLGVADDDTFVARLNAATDGTVFLNFGVPGFSTDQEALLIESRVLGHAPDVVMLMVYLANDLIDNGRPFALNVDNAKPYFAMAAGKLALRNVPVPKRMKPAALREETLTTVVLGGIVAEDHWAGFLGRLEVVRRLGVAWPPADDVSAAIAARIQPSVALFAAIVGRAHAAATAEGARLVLALVPGRSFVEDPAGYSAQYQDAVRRAILAHGWPADMAVVDLAAALRERYVRRPGRWYYPNEGHLTPAGHRVVAEFIAEALRE